jgi:hypothetical protein
MSIDARVKKLSKGLPAKKAADAFVRARENPANVSPEDIDRAAEFEATVEGMFLMAAVDGDISEQELAQLAASVDAFADMAGHSVRIDPGPLLSQMRDALEKDGWNQRLVAVASRLRDPEARAFAFRLAAGVAFVDDFVAHSEAAALEAFASAFALSADDSQEILYDVRESLFA